MNQTSVLMLFLVLVNSIGIAVMVALAVDNPTPCQIGLAVWQFMQGIFFTFRQILMEVKERELDVS